MARHLRRMWRQRLIVWPAVIAVLVWLMGEELHGKLSSALALVLLPTLTAPIIAGSGIVAEDMESGSHMLDVMHGARPVEVVLGAVAAVFVAALPPFLIVSPAAFVAPEAHGNIPVVLLASAWTLVTVLAWSTLAVLLGACTRGKANAGLLLPLFLFSAIPASELPVGRFAPIIADSLRWTWDVLPLMAHHKEVRDNLLYGLELRPVAAVSLLAGPVVFGTLATWRVARLEPAGAWRK